MPSNGDSCKHRTYVGFKREKYEADFRKNGGYIRVTTRKAKWVSKLNTKNISFNL